MRHWRQCGAIRDARGRGPLSPFQPTRWTALAGYFSSRPRSVLDTYSVEMQQRVEQAGRGRAYDVVIAAEIDVAPYAMELPDVPRVFEGVKSASFMSDMWTSVIL